MNAEPEQSRPQGPTPAGSLDAIREAMEYGVDISLFRANSALMPADRLRRHQIALNAVETLRKAKHR